MKHQLPLLLLIALTAFLPQRAHAFEPFPTDRQAQECYGIAMVGFDSVINSRLGVPPEAVMDLAASLPVSESAKKRYSSRLLRIILDAYLWEESPHTYAVNVFYRCAASNVPMLQADLDW